MANDVFDTLKKFGLTPYEIKAYRALLLNGPLTPMEAVSIAGLPQPRIYDVFGKLMEKGFIEMSPDRKKVYRARDVQTVLGKRIEEMSQDLDNLSKEIAKTAKSQKNKEPYMWLIQSESKIRSEIRRLIDNTEDELIISLNADSLKAMRKNIISAIGRGVTVAMVVFPDADDKLISNFSGAIIRKRRGFASEVVISDRSFSLIRIDNGNHTHNYAISVDEDEVIHITSYYFYHTIWLPSETVSSSMWEYPLRLRNSWLACDLIDSSISRGVILKARLTGQMKGKQVRLTGTIDRALIEYGFMHSFYIKARGKTYSVGGKSARFEDIAMEVLEISGEVTT